MAAESLFRINHLIITSICTFLNFIFLPHIGFLSSFAVGVIEHFVASELVADGVALRIILPCDDARNTNIQTASMAQHTSVLVVTK